jgi:hypothetical protein
MTVMKTFGAVLGLLCLLPHLAVARLGDTPDALTKRLGVEAKPSFIKPALAQTVVYEYEYNGIHLYAYFWNGKSCEETYSKKSGSFTDAEIESLLKANNFGAEWTLRAHNLWEWNTTDASGKTTRVMVAGVISGDFTIYTVKFFDAYQAAETAEQKNRMNKF